MKTIEQFKDYCMREMSSDLAILEKIRSGVHGKLIAAAAICACAGMGLLFWMQRAEYIAGTKATLIAAGCILFVILVIIGLLPKFLMREYRSAFKMSVMDKFIKFLDSNLQYDLFGLCRVVCIPWPISSVSRSNAIPAATLSKADLRIYPWNFPMASSEYAVRRKGGGKNWVPIFKGLFFVADCNKSFSGQTIVLPDTAESL